MPLQSTLPNLLTFCAAFEHQSFSKAARQLGVTPQAASRSVVRLEETLGVTLFRRTTRLVVPTEAARTYYRTAKQALALLEQGEHQVGRRALGAGTVRVSAPTTYGHFRLLPALAVFRDTHPEIELEVHIGNRNVDFTTEGHDFAVRLGVIRERGLVARRLGDFALGVYGAPSYLARRPPPRTVAQLAAHTCIAFVMPSTGRVLPWTFAAGARVHAPAPAVRCSDDVLATLTLARAGVGLVQTYDFLVEADLAAGRLVEVLRDARGASRPFSLVYPAAPKRSPAARALMDLLLAREAVRV